MKKTLLGTALLFALAQALPMDAQKQVRLTFNRAGGTAVSNVTVNVTDESGNAINGVTATLQSIKQGTGTDADAASTINLYAEEALLTGSRTINISDTGVGADASLSNKQAWNSSAWDNAQDDGE